MAEKRASIDGFSEAETPKIIIFMVKNAPTGNWHPFDVIKINYTELVSAWMLDTVESFNEIYLITYGIVNMMMKKLLNKQCFNSFNVLLETVKRTSKLTKDGFKIESISVTCHHLGQKGIGEFQYLLLYMQKKFTAKNISKIQG